MRGMGSRRGVVVLRGGELGLGGGTRDIYGGSVQVGFERVFNFKTEPNPYSLKTEKPGRARSVWHSIRFVRV